MIYNIFEFANIPWGFKDFLLHMIIILRIQFFFHTINVLDTPIESQLKNNVQMRIRFTLIAVKSTSVFYAYLFYITSIGIGDMKTT